MARVRVQLSAEHKALILRNPQDKEEKICVFSIFTLYIYAHMNVVKNRKAMSA